LLTTERTTFATGAPKSAIPTPETTNGATSSQYATVGDESAAIEPSPSACSTSPVPISRAPPILSDSAPAIGATNIGISVHGRMRRPEPSGE
jgi:hypothetical protein